jgi:hypothetical protein
MIPPWVVWVGVEVAKFVGKKIVEVAINKTGNAAYKRWPQFQKWYTGIVGPSDGIVAINYPPSGAIVPHQLGFAVVGGTHKNPKGNYWLVRFDFDQNRCWPKNRITLDSAGSWQEKFWYGYGPKERDTFVAIFGVSDPWNKWFRDTKDRCDKLKIYKPIICTPSNNDFWFIDSIILKIR